MTRASSCRTSSTKTRSIRWTRSSRWHPRSQNRDLGRPFPLKQHMLEWATLPDDFCRVAPQLLVRGEDGEAFFNGLGGEQAVEWIAVVEGQHLRAQDMVDPQRQDFNAVVPAHVAEVGDRRSDGAQLADGDLDAELP